MNLATIRAFIRSLDPRLFHHWLVGLSPQQRTQFRLQIGMLILMGIIDALTMHAGRPWDFMPILIGFAVFFAGFQWNWTITFTGGGMIGLYVTIRILAVLWQIFVVVSFWFSFIIRAIGHLANAN